MTEPTQSTAARLGIDWGTSNRRAYLLDAQGGLVRRHDDGAGILHVGGGFAGSLKTLLQTLGVTQADIILSGMVGSRNGWREVPYLSTSEPLSRLGDFLVEVDANMPGIRCRIVPGYQYIDAHGAPDVMRGEETQVYGALAQSASGGWFLLPGTHSKWVRVEDGRIEELVTFMTGELFALMSEHGTLAKVMRGAPSVPDAFEAGVRAARHGGFTHTAFGCRALVVTNRMPPEHTSSYLSGLLIGTELHDILKKAADDIRTPVQIVGSPALAARYVSALELLGIQARVWQPDSVYVAALQALFNTKR